MLRTVWRAISPRHPLLSRQRRRQAGSPADPSWHQAPLAGGHRSGRRGDGGAPRAARRRQATTASTWNIARFRITRQGSHQACDW